MNYKDKKNLLLLLLILAFSSAIISGFTPITTWNSSDYFGEEYDYDLVIIKDSSYFVIDRMVRDESLHFNSEHHVYYFFSVLRFETGNPEIYEEYPEISDYDVGNTGLFTKSTFNVISFITGFGGLIVFTYLVYLSFKSLGSKKTNYFLYIAIGEILALILFVLAALYSAIELNSYDVSRGFSISYGSLIAVFSICLFLILHFKQDIILENNQKELENKKMES